MKTWILAVLLVVPCAAQEDELPAGESIEAPVGSRHSESADVGQAPPPHVESPALSTLAAPPAPSAPSGYAIPGISRRLGVSEPPKTPSRARGGAAPVAATVPAGHGVRAVTRPFLTGYVGVPYLANPYARVPHSPFDLGDDTFGYDMGGISTAKEVPHITASGLPAGLALLEGLPNSGGTVKGPLIGVPQKAGNFTPGVDFRVGVAPDVERPVFKGRVNLRILPAPRHTVLNPVEREQGLVARFSNDGPALLKVRFGAPGEVGSGQVRSVDGVVDQRIYFEAYVEAVGDPRVARVGVEAGRYPEPRGFIGDLDGWGYGFSGGIFIPSGGFIGKEIDNGHLTVRKVPFDEYQKLAHPDKVDPGDVIMVAFDPAEGNLWFGKNGRWFEGGDPATGEIPTVYGITLPGTAHHGDFRAAVGGQAGTKVTMNFGDQPWTYGPPRGFGGIPHRPPAQR